MVTSSAKALDGRVVLVTGAAGHLGSAISRAVLAEGAELIACGRSHATLDALRDGLDTDARARCQIAPVDLARPDELIAWCRDLRSRRRALHGIVNNAYHGRVGDLEAIGADDFSLASGLNLTAPFLIVRELLPVLERAAAATPGGSSVVNIASMYGTVSPNPSVYADPKLGNPAHYGATKAGMLQLTRHLACHIGSRGIRVNSVSPGPFPRPASDAAGAAFEVALAGRVPMGRIGRAEEVAGPVVFLLSAAASYVNGADLAVDGGWTAW